jgi:CRP-like cAMP-binding protein
MEKPWIRSLRRIGLFSGLRIAELERARALLTCTSAPAGEELMHEGDPGREFLVLCDGYVDVTISGRRIASLGPQDFVGEIALLHGARRTATVTAVSPLTLYASTRSEFAALLDLHPTLRTTVVEVAARREHQINQRGPGFVTEMPSSSTSPDSPCIAHAYGAVTRAVAPRPWTHARR